MLEEVVTSSKNQEAANNGVNMLGKHLEMNYIFRKALVILQLGFDRLHTVPRTYISFYIHNR